jgi:hypothetical protein
MSESAATQDRLALIDARRSEADSLGEAVTHPSMKDLVRLASPDLDDALRWLRQPDLSDNPWMLGLVDQDIQLATWRLTLVRHALRTHGPNARII